jgi:hypothetical protein
LASTVAVTRPVEKSYWLLETSAEFKPFTPEGSGIGEVVLVG